MNEQMPTSLSARAARNLANTTKTPPQMAAITPRWLLRMLPWVDVEAGMYRVNRVNVVGAQRARVEASIEGERATISAHNLRAIPIFGEEDEASLGKLASLLRTQHVAAGGSVFSLGDQADRFFIIARGQVEISKPSPHGHNITLDVLAEGNYFGEIGLLRQATRMANARAITPSVLLVLERKDFDAFLAGAPGVRERMDAAIDSRLSGLREVEVDLVAGPEDESPLTMTYVDYEQNPKQITLSSIETILRTATRVTDLYRSMDQLREQLRLVIEAMRERQEWEIINNPRFGLLAGASSNMRVHTRTGAPTPDDFDELLSLVWKEPAFFLMHPKAIAAFGRECTRRGVPPPTMPLFGSPFLTWRGVPLVPSDKLPITRVDGVPVTRILLMRVGAERQGVVALHQPSIGDPKMPSLAIRLNGVDMTGIANYMLSLYFSAAILTDDAVGVLENVELGHYHDRR